MQARELEKMLLEDGWYVKNQKGFTDSINT